MMTTDLLDFFSLKAVLVNYILLKSVPFRKISNILVKTDSRILL